MMDDQRQTTRRPEAEMQRKRPRRDNKTVLVGKKGSTESSRFFALATVMLLSMLEADAYAFSNYPWKASRGVQRALVGAPRSTSTQTKLYLARTIPSRPTTFGFSNVDADAPPPTLVAPFFSADMVAAVQAMKNRTMTQRETATMTAVGTLFSAGIVYTLGTSGEVGSVPNMETIEGVAGNIIDASFPLTGSDVVSVALGEGIASVAGAGASILLAFAVRFRQQAIKNGPTVTDAVADGDFLLTQAAALPLLGYLGLSPLVAIIGSTLFAVVPSEFVKFGAESKQQQKEEQQMMQDLLDEQQRIEYLRNRFLPWELFQRTSQEATLIVDPRSLKPVTPNDKKPDLVEIFCDVTKWLEFGVLSSDYGGHLIMPGTLIPGAESAIYGVVAAVSAQVYADTLYSVFSIGKESKQEAVKSRSLYDWIFVYLSKAVYAAILFGVYELAQIPANALVSAILSGGADGCAGSQDFDLCLEVYVANNPPGASAEGQLRSLVIRVVSLLNQITP